MNLDFMDILSSLVGLFVLIAVGYGAARINVIPVSASPILSNFLMKITLPCTIFLSLLRPYDPSFLRDILTIIGLALMVLVVNLVMAWVLSKVFRVPDGRWGMWRFCVVFLNCGLMGMPICLALFGDEGMAFTALFSIPFNLTVYTIGAALASMDHAAASGSKEKLNWRSLLFTGINIAAVTGLIFYFAQITPPELILTPMRHLSNATTPLSMFVTGLNLANGRFSAIFRDRDILTSCLTRLVLMPAVCLVLIRVITGFVPIGNPIVTSVVLINATMPAPTMSTIIAEAYGADQSFAAGMVFMTSLLCVFTIPIMALML